MLFCIDTLRPASRRPRLFTSARCSPRWASWLAPPCRKQRGEDESRCKASSDNWDLTMCSTFGKVTDQNTFSPSETVKACHPSSPTRSQSNHSHLISLVFRRREEMLPAQQSRPRAGTRSLQLWWAAQPNRWLEKEPPKAASNSQGKDQRSGQVHFDQGRSTGNVKAGKTHNFTTHLWPHASPPLWSQFSDDSMF